MTYRVELLAQAERDLETIYLAKDVTESPTAARWFRGLEAAVLGLCSLPRRCPITPESAEVGTELRQLLYGTRPHVYRIVFEIDEIQEIVRIVAIRDGARHSLPV